ncbi:Zinc finger, N-recognin [Kalmanozyma brasiliensis GHG001]|uniref:UBR-type domain-containing protein n=1 Tax=Kalmanozyma brasiliensis (strain GHG001) TaxID=1365824 RepID=V5EJM3_KALBG|nr:Zinc finger, N-recognin [Kalmanozyma brasiliensis GHG001]EST04965.1 Zinc finger, N-recognin [Kalmanozyma brasiliensis GHG001]
MSEVNNSAGSSSATGSTSQSAAAQLPDPSLPAPNLGEDEVGFTAADLIAQQSRLEAQANEAIPFQFDTCTYDKGYIRQPVYACKTCGGGGVCAGCSVSCHAEHELVELFNKRKFRCDCGTPNLYRQHEPNRANQRKRITEELVYPEGAKPCSLRKPGFNPQNDANAYNHNFDGGFCYCERGKTYDPEKEDETMFQCIVCEEWLHESCTSLRPSSSTATPETEPPLIDHDLFDLMICDACVRKPDNDILRRYAGAKGWMTLAPSQAVAEVKEHDLIAKIQVPTEDELREAGGPYRDGRSWQIFGLAMEPERAITETEVSAAADGALLSSVADLARSTVVAASSQTEGASTVKDEPQAEADSAAPELEERREGKRRAEDQSVGEAAEGSDSKRVKVEREGPTAGQASEAAGTSAPSLLKQEDKETKCTLPTPLAVVSSLPYSKVDEWTPALSEAATPHRYDIFLSEDFRDRICRCADCLPKWAHLPHVLDAEETYAPPSDPHASVRDDDAASITSSTYDLGMAALRTMPREKMINTMHAYSKFRDALWEHLKPFAGTGKMVREEDVRAFFQKKLNAEQ